MTSEDKSWLPIDARLSPVTNLPLDNIQYHESPTHVYLVATNSQQRQYRFLKLGKDNERLESYLDPNVYTKPEIDGLLSCLKAGGKIISSGRAKAILGFVRFTQGYYVVLVTRRRLVARIGSHRVYEARGTTTVSLCELEQQSFFSRRRDDDIYREQFCTFDTSQYFYYSHTYDLTNTLQTNMTTPARTDGAVILRAKFLWNEHLLKPTNMCLREGVAPPAERAAGEGGASSGHHERPPAHELLRSVLNEWAGWVVRAIRGCVAQFPLECSTGSILLTLIGRTSKNFAGARYLRRGVNDDGNVANYVEVEQIVCDTTSLVESDTKGLFSSYVQVRGSVPVHWHHPMVQRPKPPIKLGLCDPKYPATQKHFAEIVEDLGVPVIVVNLLKSHEKKTREGVLTTEYVKALRTICRGISSQLRSACEGDMSKKNPEITEGDPLTDKNRESSIDPGAKTLTDAKRSAVEDEEAEDTDAEEDSSASPIRYVAFDLRNSADRAWNYMTCIAERECDHVDMFACTTKAARLQHGVVRSNCVDCIDRTNMAQFFFGLHALGKQLQYLGKIYSNVDLSQSPTVYNLMLHMYLLLGDSIAIQYGGSAQVGAGLLHRGLAWDKIMGIKRLYNNIVVDKDKQTVTNLFLGLYQPRPDLLPLSSGLMRLPPHRTVEKRMMMIAAGGTPAAAASEATTTSVFQGETSKMFGATPTSSKLMIGGQSVPYRVIDVGEVESDYYLHVPYGPQKPQPPSRTWFRDALSRHKRRMDARLAAIGFRNGEVTASCDVVTKVKFAVLDDLGSVIHKWPEDLQRTVRSLWFCSHGLTNASDDESDNAQQTPTASTLVVTNSATSGSSSARALFLTEGIDDESMRAPVQLCEKPSTMTYFEIEPDYGNSCELVHNHRQFVDAVLASRHTADRKALERLCDTPVAAPVLDVMKMACLLRYGPLSAWNVDTFLEALEELEPEVHPRVFSTIKRHHVDVYAICRSSFEYIPDKKTLVTLLHFVKLLRNIPVSDEAGISNYLSGPAELVPLEYTEENVAFPERSTSYLQQFFSHSLQSSSIQRDIRKLLAAMADPVSGIKAQDVVRFRDRHDGSAIPEPVVMRRVFLISTLEKWLLANSPRLGLSLHLAPEKSERSASITMFVRWLTQASILIKLEVPQAVSVGLTVTVVHVKDLLSESVVLFTLRQFLEPVVVEGSKAIVVTPHAPPSLIEGTSPRHAGGKDAGNSRPRTRHAEEVLVVPAAPPTVDSLSVVHMSATAASDAFSALATFFDDESTTSSRHALLKFSESYSSDLRRIDLALLSDPDVRTAFFINVFNVLFIHSWLLISQRPSMDLSIFYSTHGYIIGGHFFSLADLKHGVLRSNRPGPTSFLPQFLDDDPRINLSRSGGERKDVTLRIILGLVDTYLAPDKLTDLVPYDPIHFEAGNSRNKSQSFIDVSNSSIFAVNKAEVTITEDGFDLIDRPPSDDSSGDEQATSTGNHSPLRGKQSSIFFSSWFRAGKKACATSHFCLPLYGTMLWKQLESIEEKYAQAMSDPAQPQIQIAGGPPYLRLVQPLIGLEEVGLTAEEVMRTLQARKKAPRAKATSMSASSESKRRHAARRRGLEGEGSPTNAAGHF
jgi:hypothetical protein